MNAEAAVEAAQEPEESAPDNSDNSLESRLREYFSSWRVLDADLLTKDVMKLLSQEADSPDEEAQASSDEGDGEGDEAQASSDEGDGEGEGESGEDAKESDDESDEEEAGDSEEEAEGTDASDGGNGEDQEESSEEEGEKK